MRIPAADRMDYDRLVELYRERNSLYPAPRCFYIRDRVVA